jgi:hypothetical protein
MTGQSLPFVRNGPRRTGHGISFILRLGALHKKQLVSR